AEAAELALDLPVLYASGREGKASTEQPENGNAPDAPNLDALFDVLLKYVPAPKGDAAAPLQAHVTNLDASPFLGSLAMVGIFNGSLSKGLIVTWFSAEVVKTF